MQTPFTLTSYEVWATVRLPDDVKRYDLQSQCTTWEFRTLVEAEAFAARMRNEYPHLDWSVWKDERTRTQIA